MKKQIVDLCEFADKYRTSRRAIRSSDPEGRKALVALRKLSKEIESSIDSRYVEVFRTVVSKGQSNMPKVLFISIIPRGKKVYESMSVTVTFDTYGRGVLVGLMEAASLKRGWLPCTIRTPLSPSNFDVNGPKKTSHYNDKYINPREFQVETFEEDSFVEHLNESLALFAGLLQEKQGYSFPDSIPL